MWGLTAFLLKVNEVGCDEVGYDGISVYPSGRVSISSCDVRTCIKKGGRVPTSKGVYHTKIT
jgi:hypothetical protein